MSASVEFSFGWERNPDQWGFSGLLHIHEIENLETVLESEVLKQVPETRLALPFVLQTASVDFRGELPPDGETPTEWRFDFVGKEGAKYGVDVKIDPSQIPWNVTLSCSPFELPAHLLSVWAPSEWAPDLAEGTCRVLELDAGGSWGDWESWRIDLKVAFGAESLSFPGIPKEFKGTQLILDTAGTGKAGSGTLSVVIDEIPMPPLASSVRGFRARDLDFTYTVSKGEFTVSGPWTVRSAPGGAYSGTLSFSNTDGYTLRAVNKDVEWSDWEIPLVGTWSGVLKLSGTDPSDPLASIAIDLTGDEARLGGIDFSRRPVRTRLEGTVGFGASPAFDYFSFGWGQAFQLEMREFDWDDRGFRTDNAVLTGDLLVLSEFFPGVAVNPRVGKWLDPKGWKVTGGFEVVHEPALSISTRDASLDTGRGQGGPFSFTYADASKVWSIQSPTLRIGLEDLAREFRIPGLQIEGIVDLSANVTGLLPSARKPGEGVVESATVRAFTAGSNGIFFKTDPRTGKDEPIVGWNGLEGSFEVDWSPVSRKLQTRLRTRDLIWYTRVPTLPSDYPKSLTTNGASLHLTATRDAPGRYRVDDFVFSQGEQSPVVMKMTGGIEKRGGVWKPDLKVRVGGEQAKVTPVFRGWQLGGTGNFLGTIRGDDRGKWILEGEVDCRDTDFEFVIGPAKLEGIRGTFYFRDVLLDEVLDYRRWVKRPVGDAPTEPDSLARAFEQGGVEPNLRVRSAQFGRMRLADLSAATYLGRDAIYVNRLEGKFAQGGHPLKMTGFVFFQPGVGVGWRIRSGTSRVPFTVAIPGIGDVGLDYDAVEVDIYSTKNPGEEFIETRTLRLGVPIGRIKNIPGIGETIFGWTPDVLGSRILIIQRKGFGPWKTLNPLNPADIRHLPKFFLQNLPEGLLNQMRGKGSEFLKGVGSGIRDTFFGGEN